MSNTQHLSLLKETWTTSSDVWGNRFTPNFHLVDRYMGIIQNARRWSAGTVFRAGDVIFDPTSNLLVKAAANFTTPNNTTLLEYLANVSLYTNITSYNSSCELIVIHNPTGLAEVKSPVITVEVGTLYTIQGLTHRGIGVLTDAHDVNGFHLKWCGGR